MSYISLYRKWRPQTFAELVGQEHVARTLTNAIKNDRVAHAYLFTGPRGTGKTSTAKILAKSLNCEKGPTPSPCGKCGNCVRIGDGSSLDVLEIDAASNRGIDEIRDLREKVHFSPTEGPKKIYIIDEVHMLTTEAFNALLKMLEEPPAHVIFILATTEPSKVLPTIISRCQRFDFRRILFADLVTHLKKVAGAEKIRVEDQALELIAKQAQGGLRDALGMLDQLASYTGKDVKSADVAGLLGLIGSEKLFQAMDIIASGAAGDIFTFAHQLAGEGRDIRQFTKELIEHGRNLFVLQNEGADELINATSEEIFHLKEQAKKLPAVRVRRLLDIFSRALTDMKADGEPQFVFELAMLQIMRPEADESLEAIRERLERLELNFNGGSDLSADSGKSSSTEKAAPAPDSAATAQKPEPQKTAASSIAMKTKAKSAESDEVTPPNIAEPAESGLRTAGDMSRRELERFWPTIMAKIKQKSLSAHALLIECRPVAVEDGKFIIGMDKDWQRDLLQKANNIAIIKWAIQNILQGDLKVVCRLDSKNSNEKTGGSVKTIEPNSEPDENRPESAGADALNLIQENFGAEIVGDAE